MSSFIKYSKRKYPNMRNYGKLSNRKISHSTVLSLCICRVDLNGCLAGFAPGTCDFPTKCLIIIAKFGNGPKKVFGPMFYLWCNCPLFFIYAGVSKP